MTEFLCQHRTQTGEICTTTDLVMNFNLGPIYKPSLLSIGRTTNFYALNLEHAIHGMVGQYNI